MNFRISFPNSSLGNVSIANIDSFTFAVDIYKMYAGAKIIFKNLKDPAFNDIKIGQEVDITLSTTTIDDEANSFTNHMRILTFDRDTSSPFVTFIKVTLLSSWYFVSTVQTQALFGSVGEIVKTVFDKNFSKEDISTDFISTSDPARIRYQISENPHDFLKRILKYGVSQNTPLYLYTDAQNTVNLKSLNDFVNSRVTRVLVPDEAAVPEIGSAETDEDLKTSQRLRILNYKLAYDNERSSSSQTTIFTTDSFVSSSDVKKSITMRNAENNNSSLSSTTTPPRVVYLDWSYTPQDAIAISTKAYQEENFGNFSLAITANGFLLNALPLGSLNKLILPRVVGEKEAQGEGGYIVNRLEYTYKDNMPTTKAFLFLARYN